ncbi:MAG: ankyrin repeat domain-containing protein, partial [Gammaproteobacteria bacterium]
SWLYANWGLNHEKQSNIDQAINHYVKVMAKPRNFDRNDRVQRWTKGHLFPLLEKREKYVEADKLYTKYINDFPSESCVLQNQADNKLFNFGDYEAAIKQNILASKKGCHNKSDSLAVAYYLKWYASDNSNSTKDGAYRQAEAMAPDDARLFYYLARSKFTSPVIESLINIGRDLSTEDREGLTALLLAVYEDDYDAISRLVDAGADINGVSSQIKVSPLGLAVIKQNTSMVKFLVDKNADTEVLLPNGISIYKWAKESGHDDISHLLGDKQSI